jgi:hypothetical protein
VVIRVPGGPVIGAADSWADEEWWAPPGGAGIQRKVRVSHGSVAKYRHQDRQFEASDFS